MIFFFRKKPRKKKAVFIEKDNFKENEIRKEIYIFRGVKDPMMNRWII